MTTGRFRTMSGGRPLGWCHSFAVNTGNGGRSAGSPNGAPASAHAATVSIWA